MRLRRASLCNALTLACLVFLGSCTQHGALITRAYISPTYSPTVINSAARYDILPVEVAGTPFSGNNTRLAEAVVSAIRNVGSVANLPFAPAGDHPSPKTPYRMVVLFDAAPDISHYNVCNGSRKRDAAGASVRMMLTLCLGKDVVTSLRARRKGLTGPEAPDFRRFVKNATAALFPRRDETRGDGSRDDDDFF